MNRTLVLAALLVCFATAVRAGTITTLRGKTYRDCHIAQIHPDGISFTHREGAAKILFTDLPRATRDQYGYDPKKASAYSKKIAEQRKVAEKNRQERDARMAEAISAAQFANQVRNSQIQAQYLAYEQSAFANQIYNGWTATAPITGPAFSAGNYRHSRNGSGGYYPTNGFGGYYPSYSTPNCGYQGGGYNISGSFGIGNGVRLGVGFGNTPALGYGTFAPAIGAGRFVPGIGAGGFVPGIGSFPAVNAPAVHSHGSFMVPIRR